MTRHYCTYFDRNYLSRGLAMIESLARHDEQGIHVYVICLDDISFTVLREISLPFLSAIPLHALEHNDTALQQAKGNRSQKEYYWTLTPSVILRIFEWYPSVDLLTYVDADLFFYSSPTPIFDEFGNASTLIHPHRYSPDLRFLEEHGIYNVGLLCFRRDTDAFSVLEWWRTRCNEWCYNRIEDGKFGDQLYLNDWPERFKGVHVLQHLGAGVAPWNHGQYRMTRSGGNVEVNGVPLIFYHFHALSIVLPGLIIPIKYLIYSLSSKIIELCIFPYITTLHRWGIFLLERHAQETVGMANMSEFTPDLTFIALTQFSEQLRVLGIRNHAYPLDSDWLCFISPQFMTDSEVS